MRTHNFRVDEALRAFDNTTRRLGVEPRPPEEKVSTAHQIP